jgi:hypothetical protein
LNYIQKITFWFFSSLSDLQLATVTSVTQNVFGLQSAGASLPGGAPREKVNQPKMSGTEWKTLFVERRFQKSSPLTDSFLSPQPVTGPYQRFGCFVSFPHWVSDTTATHKDSLHSVPAISLESMLGSQLFFSWAYHPPCGVPPTPPDPPPRSPEPDKLP